MPMLINEILLSIDHLIIVTIVIELEHLRTLFFYPVMQSFPILIEASFCHN